MNMNPLPPQAYTKETLGKAFAWLQAQNESIKEMATSPDILVSLYLKAKLNGEAALERPSIQNFKNELKSLAGMIGEFEPHDLAQAMLMAEQPMQSATAPPLPRRPEYKPAPPSLQPSPAPTAASLQPSPSFEAERDKTQMRPNSDSSDLDMRSKAMIQEVKNDMNLSSDQEALRLLISVGYKGLKKL